MKKICFIADAASPHTKKWVEQCRELQCELIVISHQSGDIPGATVIVHPLSLVGFPRYALGVRRLIRTINPDLIHAHQFGAHGLYALFANCAPVIISAWGSDILVNTKRSLLLRGLVRWQIGRAVLITAVNSYLRDYLINLGAAPEKVLTVPIGIKQAMYDKLAHVKKEEGKFIICSPRLHEPIYHPGEIVEAFAMIAEDYPKVELWILGDGSLTQSLQEYVRLHQLDKRVRFWGRVSPEQVGECLAKSQIVVSIPSSDALPVSILTGMAAGCLPVLSDLPTFKGWITDGVNGLMIDDFTSLPDVLRRGIEDQTLRNQAAFMNRNLVAQKAIMEKHFGVMLERYRKMITLMSWIAVLFLTIFSQAVFYQFIDICDDLGSVI